MQKLRAFRQPQFLLYLSGGVLSALIDIGLMQLLLAGGLGVLTATSAGFLGGLLVNYLFHAHITFKQPRSRSSFVRYMCLVGANYLLTLLIVAIAVWLCGSALVGKLLSLPIIAANGFLLGKYWIFKGPSA